MSVPLRSLAAALAALLAGCAPSTRPVLLDEKPLPAESEKRWEKYGAYWIFDETFAEQSDPGARILVNRRLKILTRDGASAGAVEVPRYSEFLMSTRLGAVDSAGNPMQLDTVSMLRDYRKSGKLVFPKVGPGCVLDIRMEFSRTSPITVLEHWFSNTLPVARGRFTLSTTQNIYYDIATYGPVRKGTTRMERPEEQMYYQAWEVSDIAPRSRIDYQEEIDAAEPRVSLVMRRFGINTVISDWAGLSKQYEEIAFKPAFFATSDKVNKKVDELCVGKTAQSDMAEAIFEWVSDNISLKGSDLDRIDPDKVINSGQGNVWEMAALLKAMFLRVGLSPEVVVTRPRSYGGFDPKFQTPAQMSVPLVTVYLDGKNRLAFPFVRGGALGEYPDDYFGLSGLSLKYADSASLPPYSGGETYEVSSYRIDPSLPDGDQKMDLELGGYLAYAIRVALYKQAHKEVKEVFQKFLGSIGASNALHHCEVSGLEARGKPLVAKLAFRNPNQAVERKGETQMRLGNLFEARFASYDSSRSAGFKNSLAYRAVERIEASKPAGRRLEADIPCTTADNALFKVTCNTQDLPDKLVFTRELLFRQVKLNASEMRALYPQIQELNRIREGSLIVRGGDAGTSAAAAEPKRGKRRRD